MVALNEAVAGLVGDRRKVVNIGAGTGTFEWFVSTDPAVQLVASEFDEECVAWCLENRRRPNIVYGSQTIPELIEEYGQFDLSVAIDVIEHVADYAGFLREFSGLSEHAIITTPNKARSYQSLVTSPPGYFQHVREWTAGEFYWVLRTAYSDVRLYAMPDVYVPKIERVGLLTTMTPLIAVCRR